MVFIDLQHLQELAPKSEVESVNFSFFSLSGQDIDLEYYEVKWFASEINQDPSLVFEVAPKYCISDSFAEYEDYSISSKGFLPTVVDII